MDETEPLLPRADEVLQVDHHVVDFDPEDPENPLNWPKGYKWGIVLLLACMAFVVTFTCSSVVPVAHRIVSDLDGDNNGGGDRLEGGEKSASVLLVTIWELGEAAGPLLIAPLSEVYGRWPVMNVCNVGFVAATAAAALSSSTTSFIAARCLTGLAVASNVLSPAIVGDMFVADERGAAVSLIMLAPLLGGAIGPAVAGAVAQTLGWRQVVWVSVALAGSCEVLFLVGFRETYKVRILQRRWNGERDVRVDPDASRRFWNSILRPAVVFLDSAVLQALSLYGALVFSYFYVMTTTLPDILQQGYGLSPALTGSSFIAFSIGSAVTVVICNLFLDRIYIALRRRGGGGKAVDVDTATDPSTGVGVGGDVGQHPEYRLPLAILGGFGLPVVVALYGWIAQTRPPLPVMLVCLGLMGTFLLLAFLPLTAYVVDAFGLYAASAMTALIVSRCLVATFLPLVTGPLVDRLGYGWGFTVMGGWSLCLAPIPVLVFVHGARWRRRSAYTSE